MDKQFKIAYIGVTSGDRTATNYEDMVDQIGVSTFNVTADKIIDIIKDHNIDSAEGKFDYRGVGLQPEKQCRQVHGGRSMGFFTKEDLLQALIDVEVIIVSCVAETFNSFTIWQLLSQNLVPKSCIIVFRLPFVERRYNLIKHVTDIMKYMGIDENGDHIITKKRFGKNKIQKQNRKIFSIGLESMGGLEPDIGIKQLHSALFHKEVTDSIIKPVKETLYTGKSLVSWTTSFRNWIFGSAS